MYNKEQENTQLKHLSVCDVIRDNAEKVIIKIESLLPTNMEDFSNLQEEYLRIARDFFSTCYIAEKEILDKIGVDQKSIQELDNILKISVKTTLSQIDMASTMQKMYVDNSLAAMRTYDEYVKIMLSSYSKFLEYYAKILPKN